MAENDVILNGVLMTQSTGPKNTMPQVAPDGQLLVARTEGQPTELWCGTGVGVEQIACGGGGGGESGGYQLFDIVFKDRILSYSEKQGLEPLGSYVYKEAVEGTRYGYPDFYNKCIEEYDSGTLVREYVASNVIEAGSIVNNQGIISGFNGTSYVSLQDNFNPGNSDWEMMVKFTTGTSTATGSAQMIVCSTVDYQPIELCINTTGYLHFGSYINNTGTFLIDLTGITLLNPNTTYYCLMTYSSTSGYELKLGTSKDNLEVERASAVTTPISPSDFQVVLGVDWITTYFGNIFNGSIDLNECYINIGGSRWWTGTDVLEYKESTNKHRFYDIANKQPFDNLYNSRGEAWYYGVDTNNERIFLPRSTRFKNGNTSDVGEYQEAGLPELPRFTTDGFYWHWQSGAHYNITSAGYNGTMSSGIYGKSNTVEYSSTKLIPYMCVGTTIFNQASINAIDITSSNNDNIPLGFSTYQGEGTTPSPAWLKSSGQWNSGEIYTTFYNYYAARIGENFCAGLIVDSENSYTDYDLVINQTEQTFRLPLLTGERVLVAKKLATDGDQTWYNLYSDGWCEQCGFTYANSGTAAIVALPHPYLASGSSGYSVTATDGGSGRISYGCEATSTNTITIYMNTAGNGGWWKTCGYSAIPQLSEYTEPISLYFKVANALQNQQLLDAGEVMNEVQRIEALPHIIKATVSGANGYNVYSNGYCEQWGRTVLIPDFGTADVYLTKKYKDLNYNITKSAYMPGSGDDTAYNDNAVIRWSTRTTSSFQIYQRGSVDGGRYVDWTTRGYLAEGEY